MLTDKGTTIDSFCVISLSFWMFKRFESVKGLHDET